MLLADVILPVPFETFTYSIPPGMEGNVSEGSRVLVQFGRTKTYAGIVLNIRQQDTKPARNFVIKPIIDTLDEVPIVIPSQIEFWKWIASYYLAPLGDVYKAACPAGLKKGKAKPKSNRKQVLTQSIPPEENGTQTPTTLNSYQQEAFDQINACQQPICLLHGVTSSGKTEIYIHLILQAISKGQQVLYLLPEIALTTQIMERLRRVFGNRLGVYHSKFSDTERANIYQQQLSDHPYDVILGVRSSIFLPFQRLGLVIIDEEHETSYKQQDPAPRYHARNAAMMLARQFGAKTILGTATPSIETYYRARSGQYGYVSLTHRYADMQLPDIEVVDIKRLRFQKRMHGAFSPRLIEAIGQALEQGEQIILFQNRRGFSSFIQCKTCGWVPRCQHCDVSLTYHKHTNTLTCHYCGASYTLPEQCPACSENQQTAALGEHLHNSIFTTIGAGTERIEEQISKLFPTARISRMDLDTAKTRAAYERIIDHFSVHECDILIGTQMVSKGLDFDHVSVVGILDADTMLNLPDFRSYERTFHTLAQVAGRAGRKGRKGTVILQTRSADSPIIQHVVNNNYEAMYREQMAERELFHYPPFHRLIYVYLRHRDNDLLDHAAQDMADILRRHFGNRVLGPDRPPVSRIQSLHIRKIILKIEQGASVAAVRQLLLQCQQQLLSISYVNNLNIHYDVDPV